MKRITPILKNRKPMDLNPITNINAAITIQIAGKLLANTSNLNTE